MQQKLCKMDSQTINNLASIEFAGPIVIVDDETVLEYAITRIYALGVVGFDTESRPAFVKGQKFPISIIQIALLDEAFIFKLDKIGYHEKLVSICSDDKIKKIGIGVKDDIRRLNELKKFEAKGFVDLSDIARSKGFIQCGARTLTAFYLGKRLVKSSQKTNWAKKSLTERQLRYAATDAWVCLKILPLLEADQNTYVQADEEAL